MTVPQAEIEPRAQGFSPVWYDRISSYIFLWHRCLSPGMQMMAKPERKCTLIIAGAPGTHSIRKRALPLRGIVLVLLLQLAAVDRLIQVPVVASAVKLFQDFDSGLLFKHFLCVSFDFDGS